jgi:asparagine synthetase B (glutamine-hydrolysing)
MNIKKPLYGEWEAEGSSVPATIGSHIFVFGDIKLFNINDLRLFLQCSSKKVEEIIVKGFKRLGTNFFIKLKGIYSFAIIDKKNTQVILCRDKVGTIPLYFTLVNNKLYWSSTIESILKSRHANRVNINFLIDYVSGVPESPYETPFEDIFQLPPGSYLRACKSGVEVCRYWIFEDSLNVNNDECLQLFELEFQQCIKELLFDVELDSIAVRLSGGYDSSSVLVCLKEIGIPLRAVSITFPGKQSNESLYVQYLSKKLNVEVLETKANDELRKRTKTESEHLITPFFDPYEREMGEMYKSALAKGWNSLLTGTYGDEFCYSFTPMNDIEACLGGFFLRRKLGYDKPAPFLTKLAKKQFVESFLRHWELPVGIKMECLSAFLGWGSLTQIESLYDASVNHRINMLNPFLSDRLVELSAILPNAYKTKPHSFKPILTWYLKKHKIDFIANRGEKASLQPYFQRYYLESAKKALHSTSIVKALENTYIFDMLKVYEYLDITDNSSETQHVDYILRLWQVGQFLLKFG